MAWAEKAEEAKKVDEVAKAVSEVPNIPDIPTHLQKCFQKKVTPGKTGDEWVANLTLSREELRQCGKDMLAFYKKVQEANKKQAAADLKTSKRAVVK